MIGGSALGSVKLVVWLHGICNAGVAAAGEMLAQAEPFLLKNIHPTIVVSAYKKALQSALQVCETIALPVNIQDRYPGGVGGVT